MRLFLVRHQQVNHAGVRLAALKDLAVAAAGHRGRVSGEVQAGLVLVRVVTAHAAGVEDRADVLLVGDLLVCAKRRRRQHDASEENGPAESHGSVGKDEFLGIEQRPEEVLGAGRAVWRFGD